MTSLFVVLLLGQISQLVAAQTGVVTGTVRTLEGRPAIRIRVAAMARPETATDLAGGSALASVSETDDEGRYRLENIPPGQYYILAGRIDQPTFYPGTADMSTGT